MRFPTSRAGSDAPADSVRHRTPASDSWWRALPWLAPSLIGLAAFTLLPLMMLVWLSATRWSLLGPPEPVGSTNIEQVVSSVRWWKAVGVTLVLAALTVPVQLALGVIVGHALSQRAAAGGGGTARALLLLPWMTAPLTVGVMMRWILAPSDGAIARFTGTRLSWLDDPLPALIVVAGVVIWQNAGFAAMIYATGFADVPHSLRDAAALDGAGEVRTLIHIDLPHTRRLTVFLALTGIVSAFGLYDVIIPLTAGGPMSATESVGMRIVATAWEAFDFGTASVMSLITLAIEVLVLAIVLGALRRPGRPLRGGAS